MDRTRLPPVDAQALSRALDLLLEDLDVVSWCRQQLRAGLPPARILESTHARRCAHAVRALALIRRLDPSFSRDLEATLVADAGALMTLSSKKTAPPR